MTTNDLTITLHDDVVSAATAPGILGAAARYHLARRGKQVRGRLAIAVSQRLGVNDDAARPLAVACELLHNASLVHDDIQDRDVVRRGQETVWSRFGEPIAINLGDHLLACAFREIAGLEAPALRRTALVAAVADTTTVLAQGQSDEILRRDEGSMDLVTYESTAAAKTGRLLALPVEGALLLAGARRSLCDAARRGAMAFGTAFQILDDVADLLGRKQRLEQGSDLREGKLTWPMLAFLDGADPALGERFRDFLRSPRAGRTDTKPWVQTILASNALAKSFDRVHDLTAEAKASWAALPASVPAVLDQITNGIVRSLHGAGRVEAAK